MTNIYPHSSLLAPTKPGTPVPAQWCNTHRMVVADEDLCRSHQGVEWCPAAEDDEPGAIPCALHPLVVGS